MEGGWPQVGSSKPEGMPLPRAMGCVVVGRKRCPWAAAG
jgi:hypothetical protein